MTAQLTVLASGSSGNAALLQTDGFGLLIDFGLSTRQITHRLTQRGLGWRHINAAILTHTHSDHWNKSATKSLAGHSIPLYCHAAHISELMRCDQFAGLAKFGLVHDYRAGGWIDFSKNLRVLPHEVPHDAAPTFAFRCEGPGAMFGPSWTLGYAADLGHWDDSLVQILANADLLALEFNHDVQMQQNSGRPPHLIDRVLGPFGHLSNRQGADLVRAIRAASHSSPSGGLIALHRSRQCNTTSLVESHAGEALMGEKTVLRLAHQIDPMETINLELKRSSCVKPRSRARRAIASLAGQ